MTTSQWFSNKLLIKPVISLHHSLELSAGELGHKGLLPENNKNVFNN